VIAWLRRHWIIVSVGLACLLVGSALGVSGQPEAATRTVTETRTVHDTETVTEQVTPDSCVVVINGLVKSGQMSNKAAAQAIRAAVRMDAAAIDASTLVVKRATLILKGLVPEYTDCMSKVRKQP
jgi:ketopantoate hydroxymethyltransferase